MKIAWRFRRQAFQQGLPRRPFLPLRFASTASVHTPDPSEGTHSSGVLSPEQDGSNCQAGPSNYASRPAVTQSSHSLNSDTPSFSISDFFTSSPRPATPLQRYLADLDSPDLEKLKGLHRLLKLPRAERDVVLTSSIWRKYIRLSPSVRSHMDQKALQNVLRAVIPAAEHLPAVIQRRRQQSLVNKREGKREKTQGHYGDRVITIMRDMEESLVPPLPVADGSDRESASGPRPSDYRFALLKLARLGDSQACEALASRAKKLGRPVDIRMIDSRLFAMVRYLKASSTMLTRLRADRVFRVLWNIMGDVAQHKLTPRNATITFLAQAVYTAKKRISPETDTEANVIANLDMILEDICWKAYGMNMQLLGEGPEGGRVPPLLKGPLVNALVDYWGGKGDVWRMLSLYEVLVERPEAEFANRESLPAADDVDEEVPPTLTAALQEEEEARKGFKWFGLFGQDESGPVPEQESAGEGAESMPNVAGDTVQWMGDGARQLVRDLPPHLSSTAIHLVHPAGPAMLDAPTFVDFYSFRPAAVPLVSSPATSPPALRYPASPLRTETISVLIRHIVTSGDIQLLIHVLSSALASVAPLRTEWLAALQHRHDLTNGDSTHPEWYHIPGPRVAIHQQWFWDAEVMARETNASILARTRLRGLMLQARDMLVTERAVLEGLPVQAIEDTDDGAEAATNAVQERREAEDAPFRFEHLPKAVEAALFSAPATASPAERATPFDPSKHLEILNAAQSKLDTVLETSQSKLEQKVREWHSDAAHWAERQARRAERERVAMDKKRAKRAIKVEKEQVDMATQVVSIGGADTDNGEMGWNGASGGENVRIIAAA